jgi:serine protease Do
MIEPQILKPACIHCVKASAIIFRGGNLVMSKQPNEIVPTGKRLFSFLMVLFVLAIGIGIGTLISDKVDATGPADSQLQMQTNGKPVVGGAFIAMSQAFQGVSELIEPSVVNINTESAPGKQDPDILDELRRLPDSPLPMPEEEMRRGLGSGVIVDPKGYIVTNNHVVEGAIKIQVSLPGGEEYTAKLIGADPISDIAVIKISGNKVFPYAKIGNSRNMKVGDWVIAIGSPFGFDQTVTAGIISAISRKFERDGPSRYSRYNDYLQTDAAINRGNSGGPLVNMNGEVVGINSFISTQTGGNAGVGFAVPSHIFTKVYNQILQSGKVTRGWVGVSMNQLPFTPAMAQFFSVKQGSGVLISDLTNDEGSSPDAGPAAKAGVKPEDVVIEFDGKKIMNNSDFVLAVADCAPGKKTIIKVVRQGQEKELEITIAERRFKDLEKSQYTFDEKEENVKPEIGLEINNIPVHLSKTSNVSEGAYVVSVKPGSLADDAGLVGERQDFPGDIIVAVNGKAVSNAQDLNGQVKALMSGDAMVLKFMRIIDRENMQRSPFYTSIIKP